MSVHVFVNDNVPFGARGMDRYFRHVTHGIIDHFQGNTIIFSSRDGDYAPARYLRPLRFKGSEQFGLHDFLANRAIRATQPQLVFSAWFNRLRTSVPQVFVVYDMIYEKFPAYHSRCQTPLRDLARERRLALERAERVIVISHSAARDVLEIYPRLAPAKLTVVHLGVDEGFFYTDEQPTAQPTRPYLLFVGFRSGHKNFMRLLDAFGQSALADELDLRVISALPFTPDELKLIQKHDIESAVIWMGRQSDADLRTAYHQALALVYPSEYEGFGLPILEAFAAGTLVTTSNISSMPEIGADVAFYFDPYAVDSIVASLHKLARLPASERTVRIAQGIKHAREFTWSRCESQTVQLLESILERRSPIAA